MPEIRILIVEDDAIIANDIAMCFNKINFRIEGIAYNSNKALALLKATDPDLVLLDITLEGSELTGIDIAKHIDANYEFPYIFLTSHSDRKTLEEVRNTSPYGYIVKPFTEENLISNVQLAVFRFANDKKTELPELNIINNKFETNITQAEYKTLSFLFEGLTNLQIAKKSFVSVNTVKTHLQNLFSKLDVKNRTAAIQKVISK
ncbi:MAG: response regulator transcription factor [Bacteroidota bacterium]